MLLFKTKYFSEKERSEYISLFLKNFLSRTMCLYLFK
eukprot:UN00139